MPFAAEIVSLCNPHGALFWWIYSTVRATPHGMWLVTAGFAYTTHEWYFALYSYTYWIVLLVQLALAELRPTLLGVDTAPPHPTCNNAEAVGPCLEVALLYALLTQALVNTFYWRLPLPRVRVAIKLALAIGVPLLSALSGNASWAQVSLGAALGIVVALIVMYTILYALLPHLDYLDRVAFLRNVLGMHCCRDIRSLYYRDMIVPRSASCGLGVNDDDDYDDLPRRGTAHGITRDSWLSHVIMI